MQTIGLVVVSLVGVVMLLNATFMLISPQAWFRLPLWLGARGTLTKKAYARGWGAVQVRMAGAVMLVILVWVISDFFRISN